MNKSRTAGNQRERQDIDTGRARLSQDMGAGVQSGTRGTHVVDHNHATTRNQCLVFRRHTKSAGEILLAIRAPEPDLCPGVAHTLKRLQTNRHA